MACSVAEQIFFHLHIHTEFSLADGLAHIPALMAKAHAFNMPAIALTDFNNLYAAVKFYQAALQFGIKPIIGCHICLKPEQANQLPAKLILLCQNNRGYQNLLKLLSQSYLKGQVNGLPLVDIEWLKTH